MGCAVTPLLCAVRHVRADDPMCTQRYGWVLLFTKGLDLSYATTLLAAIVILVAWLLTVDVILEHPAELEWRSCGKVVAPLVVAETTTADTTVDGGTDELTTGPGVETECYVPQTLGDKLRFTMVELWPYTIPLVVVYASEYAMQSGTWTAMGFPVKDKDARADFYLYANLSYQG